MTEAAMSNAAPNSADLFEIIRTTRSMRRLKPDPVPNDLIRKIFDDEKAPALHVPAARRTHGRF
jgi:hypothetical protein